MEVERTSEVDKDLLVLRQIQRKEDRLRSICSPVEKYIYAFECVLTWEYPFAFAILLIFVNITFWLYSITPVYCLIPIGGFLFLAVQFIANHVLHLSPDASTTEDWVNVRVSSEDGLDLIHILAILMTKFENIYKAADNYKEEHRQKFNVLVVLICSGLFFLNFLVDVFCVFYFGVTILLFCPGLIYNKVFEKLIDNIKPYCLDVERKLRIKRHVSSSQENNQKEEIDDSDVELEPFIPKKSSEPFPSFVEENNQEEEDSDTNEDFIPQVSLVSDSRDATDDEFFPDDDTSKLTLKSIVDESVLPNETAEEDFYDNVIEGPISSSSVVSGEKRKTRQNIGDQTAEEEEEAFAEGMSFDDERQDVKFTKTGRVKVRKNTSKMTQEQTTTLVGSSLAGLGSIFTKIGSFVPVTSLFSQEKKDEKMDVQMVDDEFDFLNNELEEFSEQ